jgi:hypothetical protein
VVDNITLLAETFIQVIIAVIPVAGTFYSSPDLRPVRKFECYLRGVPAGIEINQIGKLLSPQVPGARQRKYKKDRIDDIAFTRTIGPGYNGKTL